MTERHGKALGVFLAVVILLLLAHQGRDKRTPEKIAQDAAIEQARQEVLVTMKDEPSAPSYTSSDVEILGRRRLLAVLKDPLSAEIVNDQAYRLPGGGWAYCGEVNAKNGFGGFTGYRRFIAGPLTGQPVVVDGDGTMVRSEFDSAFDRVCRI